MKTLGNVIFLKSGEAAMSVPDHTREPVGKAALDEAASVLKKAKDVLKEMEELWEINHETPLLRDRFHLLRHYLSRIPAGA